MKLQAIIPAAGSGERFGSKKPKPLVFLNGKPIIQYSLETILESNLVDSVILAVASGSEGEYEKLIGKIHPVKNVRVIKGGATRCESVSLGLKALDPDTRMVLIHDGARPLVSADVIKRCIAECQAKKAVVAAVEAKSTIKRVDTDTLKVEATLNRKLLWEVQTPQVFDKEILINAHRKRTDDSATDDAVLVELTGTDVYVVKGDYRNIKITTQEDLVIAQALLNNDAAARDTAAK